MTTRQPQVFISYQRADEPFARQVREHLVAHGVTTWMDQYDIPVGAYWPDDIDVGLAGSGIVIGVLSPDAVASRNVKNEWDWAIANGRQLVLIQIRPCDIPHRYISINFIDATNASSRRWVSALLDAVGVDTPAESVEEITRSSLETGGRHNRERYRVAPAIVGREQEQALLDAALTESLAGHGSVVLIGGEAGIGKTTLTAWLGWLASEQGAVVLSGGCYDLSTTPPYGPWVEIVREWPAGDGQLPAVPDVLRGGESLGRVHSQAALFETVASFLATASAVKPLVLLLEDLHWTDEASLDLLRYVARSVGHQRVMLIVTYRDDELTRRHPLQLALPALIRESDARRISLRRLARDGLDQLIAGRYVLPDDQREDLTSHIVRMTEGNPFFAGEVLRSLEETGALWQDGDHWQLSDLPDVHVPDLIRQVIEGRLERLGDEARRLLAVAAVIGHEVDIETWIAIGGAGEDASIEVLERTIEAGLIEDLPDHARIRFTHALIRETVYSGLVSIRRRALHRQVGELLSARPHPDPDAVATHFVQAADSRAADWLVLAGERAQSAYAWSTAVERYDRALELLVAAGGEPREIGWLQYRIARLQRFRNPEHALEYLVEAQRVAAQVDDRVLAAATRFSEGLCHFFAGDFPAAIDRMSRGADLLEALSVDEQERLDLGPDDDGVPTITNPRGFLIAALAVVGRLEEAIRMGEPLTEGRPKRTALAELGWSHYGDRYGALAICYAFMGRVDDAIVHVSRAREIYRENGHYSTQGVTTQIHLNFVSIPYRTDRRHEREQLAAEAAAAYARAAAAVTESPDTSHLPLLFLSGDWDTAIAVVQAVLSSDTAPASDRDDCRRILAMVSEARGEWDLAWQQVHTLVPGLTAMESGAIPLSDALLMQRVAIGVALHTADLAAAAEWIAAHERWLQWSGAILGLAEHHVLLARYQQLAGDIDAACVAADAAVTHASNPRQPLALAIAWRTRGDLAIDRNQLDIASVDLQASLALAEDCEVPYERALTLTALARLAMLRGEDASKMLAEARAIFEWLGARPALERIVGLERLNA